MVNKAILVGRVGRDPEMRYTGGGVAVANFSIATSETFKNKQGEKQEKTEWHRIVVWNKLAEICQKYAVKGTLIYIEGQITTREWQDKEGVKRKSTEIIARNMRLLGSPRGSRDEGPVDSHYDDDPHGHEPQESASTSAQRMGSTGPEISNEDIPF